MKEYFKKIKELRKLENSESGNSFVLYVMMFGLMAMFFGLAIDSGMGFYTKNGLQTSLDSATVAAVATQTDYDQFGNKIINKDRAATFAKARFEEAKKNYPNIVKCNEKSQCSKYTGIKLIKTSDRGRYFSITATVYSKNVFLHMAGLPTQQYVLTSDARLGSLQDAR